MDENYLNRVFNDKLIKNLLTLMKIATILLVTFMLIASSLAFRIRTDTDSEISPMLALGRPDGSFYRKYSFN